MGPAFVGRAHQLAELARLRDVAAAGGGSLVLLSGEAGIGKTATLTRFAGQAGEAGVPVLAGRAVVDEGAPPFWPWLRVLEQGQEHGRQHPAGDARASFMAARFLAIERTVQAAGRGPSGWPERHPGMTAGPTTHRAFCCGICAAI
jgi:hypothetical protein